MKANITRAFHRTALKLKKHSPEILIVAGVAGTITSAVMACKATLKINDIVEEAKDTIELIHDGVENEKRTSDGELYTEEVAKKDLALVYTQTGLKIAKVYAPAIVLGALSLTAIISSNNILRKRNVALSAAYVAIDKGFKQYRNRVVERFGKEIDRELRYNIKAKEVEERVVDENGNEKSIITKVSVVDPNNYSDYARVYDDGNPGWDKDPALSLFYLKEQQAFANDKLRAQGHLFLNEVYDLLGFPRTSFGNVVGWIYDEKNPIGDNFVDFGIYDIHNEKARDFVNGKERVIVLDFNVDGPILELIQ